MDRQPDSCPGEVNAVTKNGPGSAYAVECGPRRMRILGSPNRRLRLDGLRTLAAVKETRSRKGRPAAGGGDALPSNSGRERRTRLPSVLLEATCGKISQERLDWTGFIEGH